MPYGNSRAWHHHPATSSSNVESDLHTQQCGIGQKMVLCANGFAPRGSHSLTAALYPLSLSHLLPAGTSPTHDNTSNILTHPGGLFHQRSNLPPPESATGLEGSQSEVGGHLAGWLLPGSPARGHCCRRSSNRGSRGCVAVLLVGGHLNLALTRENT